MVTPQKSNMSIPKIAIFFKGSYLSQTIILGIHVSFRECKQDQAKKNEHVIFQKLTTHGIGYHTWISRFLFFFLVGNRLQQFFSPLLF